MANVSWIVTFDKVSSSAILTLKTWPSVLDCYQLKTSQTGTELSPPKDFPCFVT